MAPSPSTRPPGSQRNLSSLWTLSIHFQLTLHTQASAKETFSFIWSTPAILPKNKINAERFFSGRVSLLALVRHRLLDAQMASFVWPFPKRFYFIQWVH